MATYRIYIRDADRRRVAEVEDYQQLDLVLRYNAVSSWVLELPADGDPAGLLAWGGGIVVTRDGSTLLSGPVTRFERQWDARTNRLTASGPDDLVWLDRRSALPVPAGPPYTSQAHDVRTGPAETVIKQYVDYNAGPSASVDMQVSGLTVAADTALGLAVTGRARFQNLLELCQALALAGGDIGFRLVQSGLDLEFQVWQPSDLTRSAIFSPALGNLVAYRYTAEAARVNHVICGGGGEGTSRTFEEGEDAASIARYGRIVGFRDRRDTTDTAELQQTIAEELAGGAERMRLSLTPIDSPGLAFVGDYALGDLVTVIITEEVALAQQAYYYLQGGSFPAEWLGDEQTVLRRVSVIQDKVREVKLAITPEQADVIRPQLGTPEAQYSSMLALFDQVRRLGGRLSNLERR